MRRPDVLRRSVLVAATFALLLSATAGSDPVPRRKMLRAEVAKLRGEVARLASELTFLQWAAPGSDGQVTYPEKCWAVP